MTTFHRIFVTACLLSAAVAQAQGLNHTETDLLLATSPSRHDFPAVGELNPAGEDAGDEALPAEARASGGRTVVVQKRQRATMTGHAHEHTPYALVAAPTLPCAPGYCPLRLPRRDRN